MLRGSERTFLQIVSSRRIWTHNWHCVFLIYVPLDFFVKLLGVQLFIPLDILQNGHISKGGPPHPVYTMQVIQFSIPENLPKLVFNKHDHTPPPLDAKGVVF